MTVFDSTKHHIGLATLLPPENFADDPGLDVGLTGDDWGGSGDTLSYILTDGHDAEGCVMAILSGGFAQVFATCAPDLSSIEQGDVIEGSVWVKGIGTRIGKPVQVFLRELSGTMDNSQSDTEYVLQEGWQRLTHTYEIQGTGVGAAMLIIVPGDPEADEELRLDDLFIGKTSLPELDGYIVTGAYRKDFQNESFPTEFGGQTDLIEAPGFARWTQDDFSGGQYAYEWGADDAMFRACRGMLPSRFDRSIRTVPPFAKWESKALDETAVQATAIRDGSVTNDRVIFTAEPDDTFAGGDGSLVTLPGQMGNGWQIKAELNTVEPGTLGFTRDTEERTLTLFLPNDGTSSTITAADVVTGWNANPAFSRYVSVALDANDGSGIFAPFGPIVLKGGYTPKPFFVAYQDGHLFYVSQTVTGRQRMPLESEEYENEEKAVYTGFTANRVACIDQADKILYVGTDGAEGKLVRYSLPSLDHPAAIEKFAFPEGRGGREITGIFSDQGRIVCAFGTLLAELTVPADASTAVNSDSTAWNLVENYRLPGQWRDAVAHNGMVYILCSDEHKWNPAAGDERPWKTTLVAWDGTDLHKIVEFPYSFRGRCITEYGGRLYVGGAGRDIGDAEDAYGELYEITGATLRLIRTFAPEHQRDGMDKLVSSSIDVLTVFEGFLFFYNDSSLSFECYDLVTDAFYGGPRVAFESEFDHRHHCRCVSLTAVRDNLEAFFVNPTMPMDGGFFHFATPNDLDSFSGQRFSSTLTTSDFVPQPATVKQFSTLKVLTHGGPCSGAAYSQDAGRTWITLEQIGVEDNGAAEVTEFDLSRVPNDRRISFRFTLERVADDGTPTVEGFTELRAFTLSFRFLGSGRKAWSLTVAAVDHPEGRDGAAEDFAPETQAAALWTAAENGDRLLYQDVDGQQYEVTIFNITENQPVVGNAPMESLLSLTLAEA